MHRIFSFLALLVLVFGPGSLLSASEKEEYDDYLSIGAIFQNESLWLKEWIEYHLLVGVDHFYLYNHRSEDDWEPVLQPYIDCGVVTLIDWSDETPRIVAAQPRAYCDCMRNAEGKTFWLALIDIDEFLLPIEADSLREVLEEFEDFGGVVVNWRTFGTSGVSALEEEELLIERLTRAVPRQHRETFIVKSIVRPEYTIGGGAHRCKYVSPYSAVDTDGRLADPGDCPWISDFALDDKLVINHYKLRTMDWAYEEKAARIAGWLRDTTLEEEQRKMAARDREFSQVEDLTIQRFVPLLRERMFYSCSNL